MKVVIKLQHEGIHNWPECPFDDVAFLRNPHRHIFHITAKKDVRHDDRDVEIIKLKREMLEYLQEAITINMHSMSCEMLARNLGRRFQLSSCEVLEDGENGAEYELHNEQ
jgi:hypothetical protein